MAEDGVGLGVILAVAFLPPLFYLIRIRNAERFSRNPMPVMLFVFAWGAIVAIILAFILEDALHLPLDTFRPSRVPSQLWMAVILAPLVEEPVKVAGLFFLRKKRLAEEEDGLVYGAAAGLGFAATENLAYELAALAAYGTTGWLVTSVLRTLTSTLLHASSSAMAGWGVAKARRNNEGVGAFLRLLLIAMLMHGLFNFFASMTLLATEDYSAALLSLLLVFIFASFVYRFTRAKIRELDRQSAHPRVG